MRTPLKTVRRLGSARSGTQTFIKQRVTAIANAILAVFFVWLVVSIAGADYGEARALLAHPVVALTLLLLVLSVTIHMRIGMQEIIEDYIHEEPMKIGLLLLNTFFTILVAAACIYSVMKISFGT